MFRKLYNQELGRISQEEFKKSKKAPITLILDNVRSQHNIGSAFRTADAFAIERIFLCGICASPPSPEIHKSALGAEFSVDWEYFESTADAVARLKDEGYMVVSVEQTENSTSLENFSAKAMHNKKIALIFGNEVKGVDQDVVNSGDLCLEIPQYGTKHSLNVSVSIGIVLWSIISELQALQ